MNACGALFCELPFVTWVFVLAVCVAERSCFSLMIAVVTGCQCLVLHLWDSVDGKALSLSRMS
jgi:hypothetical protein